MDDTFCVIALVFMVIVVFKWLFWRDDDLYGPKPVVKFHLTKKNWLTMKKLKKENARLKQENEHLQRTVFERYNPHDT